MLALLVLGTSATVFSQDGKTDTKANRKEMLEAEKVALITKELELTPEQAKVFWPVHNAYEAELKTIRKDARRPKMNAEQFAAMTDEDAQKMVADEFTKKERGLAVQKQYYQEKFPEVISVKQTAKLYHMEGQWKKMLLKKMREQRRPEHMQGRPARPER